jgi:hypothetical protein
MLCGNERMKLFVLWLFQKRIVFLSSVNPFSGVRSCFQQRMPHMAVDDLKKKKEMHSCECAEGRVQIYFAVVGDRSCQRISDFPPVAGDGLHSSDDAGARNRWLVLCFWCFENIIWRYCTTTST